MEWQPIETAPKDDSEFLIHSAADGVHRARRFDGDTFEGCSVSTCCLDYWEDATHWMPLPAPPV